MNKQDRRTLEEYSSKIDEIKDAILSIQESEEEKLGNMPEGLQESERGERIQSAIDSLEEAVNSLEEAVDYIQEAIDA